jgi:hypothetical protein
MSDPSCPAIDIVSLKAILRDHLPLDKQAEILKEVEATIAEETSAQAQEKEGGENPEKPPKIPKKLVVIVTALPEDSSDNRKATSEMSGFIAEIPEETPAQSLQEKLEAIATEYRGSRKAQKAPVECLGDLWELAPAKAFKNELIGRKSKTAVEFTFIRNKM